MVQGKPPPRPEKTNIELQITPLCKSLICQFLANFPQAQEERFWKQLSRWDRL